MKGVLKVVLALGAVAAGAAHAQSTVFPWDEYARTIAAKMEVTSLTAESLGERTDLYNGRLAFRQVDIDLPGNSKLPVTLARTFDLVFRNGTSLPLADWELDVPRISALFATRLNNQTAYGWPNNRCSVPREYGLIGPFFPADYWQGMSVAIPRGGEMLEPAANVPRPSSGGPYVWVTAEFTWFSCLPTVKNASGEGFLAVTPDGTRYWFDWMAMTEEPQLESYDLGYAETLERARYTLLATRVEDRFGNWVTYRYSNTGTTAARLERIESNDGRHIDLAYQANGLLASASDGTRTWQYVFTVQDYAYALSQVTLPDSSRWTLDLRQIANLYPGSAGGGGCDAPGYSNDDDPVYRGRITHPSGATGEYSVQWRMHSRSHVPKNCLGDADSRYSDFARYYWMPSLTARRITGPGLQPLETIYHYNNASKPGDSARPGYVPPGSWGPISSLNHPEPTCQSDACAATVSTEVTESDGSWSRYTFGNSYGYNEHKQVKKETGSGPGAILRTEVLQYEFARSGQTFPTPVGKTRQYRGDVISDSFLRPLRSRTILQDGVQYQTVVNGYDVFGRPTSVTRGSTP